MVSYVLLIHCLTGMRIHGTVLQWFCSFYHVAGQRVALREELSWQHLQECGVLQGATLSLLLVDVYMCHLI